MAFLYEEDRGLTMVKDPYPHLGPGVYQVNDGLQPKISYAPFLSTDKRHTQMAAKDQALYPGPGQYETQLNMGDSGVQAYMNKSTIIVKVQGNGSSAFKSGNERFQEDKRIKEVPGPGYYDLSRTNFRQQQSSNGSQKLDELRQQNVARRINSIPEQKTQIGQSYDDIESLAQHQRMLHQHKTNPSGQLTQETDQPKGRARGVSWDKNTKPRFDQTPSTDVGPGRYNLSENKRVRQGSPAFISETVRSYYDQLIYKTNREINAGLRKSINYRDQHSPGPGQYNDGRVAIKLQKKPVEFQFFGSSLERFKALQDQVGIGPGDYNLINNSSFVKKKNYTNATFLSTSLKQQSPIQEEERPGPGAYEIQNDLYTDIRKKQDRGLPGQFLSREKRFSEKPPICKAGPGSYDYQQDKKRAVSSCFKSGTKRDPNQKSCGPDIGQYKLDQESIGYRLQKQMKFLRNLQKIEVQKPGFDCAEIRFKDVVQDVLGNIQAPIPIPPPQTTKQITAPFKSQQPRLGYINRQYTPGVGKYQVDPQNWKINSFNTHYNKLLSDS